MKHSLLVIATAFAALVLVSSAAGQTGAIRATVPFDFIVGQQTLPAGDYKVALQGTTLLLTRLDGPGSAFVMYSLTGHNRDASPRLLFHRYGNRSFLSEAWITGMGHELSKSSQELEYARTETVRKTEVMASAAPIR